MSSHSMFEREQLPFPRTALFFCPLKSWHGSIVKAHGFTASFMEFDRNLMSRLLELK